MNEDLKPSHNKAIVPSLRGEKKVGFEYLPDKAAWEVTLGGKEAVIKQSDLFALVFYAADTDQVDKLTPVQNTEVRVYSRIHKIQLKKDAKKGEFVTARCEITVPVLIEEGLRGIIEKRKKSKILLPRTNLLNR